MSETSDNKFVLMNAFSTKSLFINLGMMLFFAVFYPISVFFDFSIVIKVICIILFIILAIYRILEALRSTDMIVENDRLVIGKDEIRASEVDELVYNSWLIYTKCKNRTGFNKYVTVTLRDNKRLEQLKSKLNEFGKNNNIRIRIMNP